MASLKLTLTYKAWATCAFTEINSIKRVVMKYVLSESEQTDQKNERSLYSGV